MALTTTTLAAAMLATDSSMVVTSATGFAVGRKVLVDQEFFQVASGYDGSSTTVPVLRGQEGSAVQAHVISANATVGTVADFQTSTLGPQTTVLPQIAGRARILTSYSASGAITLPAPGTDGVAVLNGTGTLAMTLAQPSKDMDGCVLWIIGNGKSASHVDTPSASGYGNAGSSYDVLTFQNAGQVGFILMACNGIWVIMNAPITGTSTAVSIAIA